MELYLLVFWERSNDASSVACVMMHHCQLSHDHGQAPQHCLQIWVSVATAVLILSCVFTAVRFWDSQS